MSAAEVGFPEADDDFDGDDATEHAGAHDIAVVGMAGRFPGAADPDELWHNVRNGVESVRHWTPDELRANGVPESLLADPSFVGANGPLDDFAAFDAEFFGLGPKEAAIMDPQHRQLLEVAWEALEDAGYPPERFDGDIGVFAGCGMGAYFLYNVMANDALVDAEGVFLLRHTGNDKDFLSTRISYALDLSGPSISVQTACSTSLVAIHQSCQSLLAYECDMALAGGVTIEIPHGHGYVYKEGEVLSPDGHCRAFDHRGRGTVFGSGAGIVVLRRLVDAIEDGDRILAVIKGSAVNNDGARKISYMAPSVDGQAAAVAEALAVADIDPASIHYVETHGTGTAVGDPIEIAALNQAFGAAGGPETIGIGSIKPNIGHLDTAAGVASFIKLVQAIRHRELPPSINYEAPNPVIDFRSGPFYVNDRLRPWPETDGPARGGVSSLGVGGTNAHVIVEEAPELEPLDQQPPAGRGRLLMISGRNAEAVEANTGRLADHLVDSDDDLADVAYSLHATRRAFGTRRIAVATDTAAAIDTLRSGDIALLPTREVYSERASVAFLFPGGGAHHPAMGRGLYEHEPEYRRHIDAGLARLRERHGIDLAPALFCEPGAEAEAEALLEPPSVQLPAIFLVEYALGKLYESWGIVARAMAGHSLGENTAACLAGVMTFEDCLDLVVIRGAMMESAGSGGVLSVNLAAADIEPHLWGNLVVAGVNGPTLTSVSGTVDEIAELADRLTADGVEVRLIPFAYPVHSPLFDPHLGPFEAQLRSMDLKPPSIPIASNLTGTWLTVEEATDPGYWVRQVRHAVRFADDIDLLLRQEGTLLVEVGPGASLSSFARQSESLRPGQPVFASLRRSEQAGSDDDLHLLEIVGRLWSAGLEIDPEVFHGGRRRRIPLPKYAFTHRRYFIEPSARRSSRSAERGVLARNDDLDDWFQREVWREQPLGVDVPDLEPARWLIFDDGSGLAERLAMRLFGDGHDVVTVVEGDAYHRVDATRFAIAPEMGREGYERLVGQLVEDGRVPDRIVHCWTLSQDRKVRPGSSWFHHQQERGFASLVHLAQAMAGALPESGQVWTVVTSGATAARGPIDHPEKATLFGPAAVIPRELAGVTVSLVDLDAGRSAQDDRRAVVLLDRLRSRLGGPVEQEGDDAVDVLLAELSVVDPGSVVAYRSGRRYRRFHDRAVIDTAPTSLLRSGGTYLVTGGLGGIGMFIADRLGRHWNANLVLVGRSALPPEADWRQWLDEHGPDNVVSQRLRKLMALRDAGVEVMTAAADVADVTAMTRVVDDAVARFGRLDGVIHAAGVVDDGLIATRSEADLDRVLTPKVQGALVLDQVTAPHRPDFVVSFSSTSAALGLPGQVDYAAANAFLDAYAQRLRRVGEPHRISLAWGPWLEVGMAAAASSDILDAGTFVVSPHALLDYVAVDDDLAIGTAQLSADSAWVLDEHRAEVGRAVLPGTAHIELYAEMAAHLFAEPAVVKDLTFVSPLVIPDEVVRDARVVVRRIVADAAGGGDVWKATLESGALGSSNGWHVHSEATLVRAMVGAPTRDLSAVAARCDRVVEDDNGIATRQEDHIRFGPRWRCLHELRLGEREALGSLRLADAFVSDLDRHLFHAALADIATGFGLDLVPGYAALESPPLYVPFGYGSVTLFAPIGREIRSHLRLRDTTANEAMVRFDITLCDPSGRVLAEIEDFSMVRVDGASFGDTSGSGASTAIGEGLAPDVLFERFLSAGIEPDDGWEAFQRVMEAGGDGHVIVSPLPVGPQIELITRTLSATEGGARFARPALSSQYVEARDEVEAALVDIWERLLGVDPIGVDDDFFELGGHSLVALRLFASVKSRFGVDHPMSALFDAPTVSRLAAVVRAGLGDEAGSAADTGGASGVGALGLRHVVEMSADPGTGSTPFFLVAGMFGNILNLRHLAMLIGGDRAVYGIQALGLREGEEPHRRFEDMAEAYIAEIRRIQPHGPYLLGGFSGGGVTAFEMAHQIEAAGEKVDAVIMLDSPRPGLGGEVTFADRVLRHVQDLRVAKHRYPMHYVRTRLEWERHKRRLEAHDNAPGSLDATQRIEAAFYEAVSSYEARPWQGRVELFRPPLDQTYKLSGDRYINEAYEFQLSDNGWEGYAGELVVHEVPGNHDSMVLEPNVRVLAARIVEVLAAAEHADLE